MSSNDHVDDTSSIMMISYIGYTTLFLVSVTSISLSVFSNDYFGRKLLLSPLQLMYKRINEYNYKWERTLHRYELKLNYFYNAKYNTNVNNVNPINNTNSNEMDQTTDILTTEKEVQNFISQLCIDKLYTNVRVGRIGKDRWTNGKKGGTSINDAREHFVWFYVQHGGEVLLYQIPILLFSTAIGTMIDEYNLYTGAFCFIADASSNQASNFICDLVTAATTARAASTDNDSNTNNNSNVAVIQQPYWLLCLAILMEQNIYTNDTIAKFLYGLVRLESYRFISATTTEGRKHSNSNNKNSVPSTIIITIPMSIVPIVLPSIQQVFSAHRHIFSYTNCMETMNSAMRQQNSYNQKYKYHLHNTTLPVSFDEALSLNYYPTTDGNVGVGPSSNTLNTNDPVPYTVPLKQKYLYQSMNVNRDKILPALSNLPMNLASIVETWMSSIDMFFQLKHLEIMSRLQKVSKKGKKNYDTVPNNSYIPFVFKLDLLLYSVNNDTKIQYGSNQYWLVRSLLQYVLGSQNRELSKDCMDSAIQWYANYMNSNNNTQGVATTTIDEKTKKLIENVVFQHKLILIGNKTLQDTVLPKEHWSLCNSAKKSGCSCCLPDEDDEEEDDNNDANDESEVTHDDDEDTNFLSSSAAKSAKSSMMFIDGRLGSAFDPSRFTSKKMM